MKVAEILTEMAKSKSKRRKEAKLSRRKKAENPSAPTRNNPVAKFAQSSGAGAHVGKDKYGNKKRQRQEGKRLSMDY